MKLKKDNDLEKEFKDNSKKNETVSDTFDKKVDEDDKIYEDDIDYNSDDSDYTDDDSDYTDDDSDDTDDTDDTDDDTNDSDDTDIMFKFNTNNHKIEGKHALKRDTIFKG